jgi:hypothetical protein
MEWKKIYHHTLLAFTVVCLVTLPTVISSAVVSPLVLPLESGTMQTTVSSSSFTQQTEYWAVLIGKSNYVSGPLPYSVNEIIVFKNTLLTRGSWNESHIMVLTNDNVSKENVFSAITWLDDHETDVDISVIYYVGHGGSTLTGEYMAFGNSSISDVELDYAMDVLEGRVVLIIDSCHSGGFIEECRGKNRVIMTSCAKEELSYQYSELQNGFFGYFLNFTLGHLTKSAEGSFLLARPLTTLYSKKISEKLGGDYVVHPQFSDGVFGSVKLISRQGNILDFLKQKVSLFSTSVDQSQVRIFKG